jgi:hypothetical protein
MVWQKEVGGPPSFPLFEFINLFAFEFIGNAKLRVFFEKAVDGQLHVVWGDENGFGLPVIFGEALFVQVVIKDAFNAVVIP